MRRWTMLLLACALGFLAMGCSSAETSGGSASQPESAISQVDPAGFHEVVRSPGTRVIDVRTPEEFGAGHLEGAVNIDIYSSDFAQRLDGLDRADTYAVYCRSGNRSLTASQLMVDSGFTKVYDLDGGINAWIAAGLPVIG